MSESFDAAALAVAGVRGLKPYQPGKPIEELERELGIRGSIKLASNENPRGPGPAVLAAISAAAAGASRYPDGGAFRLRARLGAELGVDAGQITLGNGSNDVLELVAHAFLGPGRSAVASAHAFIVYPLATRARGAEFIEVPARQWTADPDALVAAIRADTSVLFLANPNNPTGTWLTTPVLESLLARVPRRVIVVLDEAYFEYVDAADYPDGLRLLAAHPNLVVARTFSKIHGLAALRVGYGVSSPAVADLLNRVRQPFNVNALAQAAAVAALDDRAYVVESRRLNVAGMQQVRAGLDRLGLAAIPSLGNFVTFDCGRPARPIYEALLREGVILRPIAEYGMPNHLRLTIGLEAENERALAALARVCGGA